MRKFYFLISLVALIVMQGQSQTFNLVKDINAGVSNSNPSHLTNVNGTLFFTATTAANGTELWKSNGTFSTTVLVKDINPGSAGSSPNNLFNLNGTLYFRADNGSSGVELWKSDGTAAGTVMVKDIYLGLQSSSPLYLANLNGTLYFSAATQARGRELWKSDGTSLGTVLVKDINPGSANSSPSWFANINGVLCFSATDAISGGELWKTDGTAAGTVLVKDIYTGIDPVTGQPNSSLPVDLINVNNEIFFTAFDSPGGGWTIWKTNGQAAGTVILKPSGGLVTPNRLTDVNSELYFISNEDQLWKSNGTAAGTVMIKELDPSAGLSTPQNLTNVNGTLFFAGQDAGNNWGLWRSNGTASGTLIIMKGKPENLAAANDSLYFSGGEQGSYGREIWKSDGSFAGTVMVQDIATSGSSSPANFLLIGNNLYVSATHNISGRELWMGRIAPPLRSASSPTTALLAGEENKVDKLINNTGKLMLYPNPVQENTMLVIDAGEKEAITYSIIDQNGRTVIQKKLTVMEGSNNILIETNSLVAGVYIIAVNGSYTKNQIRFIKQ